MTIRIQPAESPQGPEESPPPFRVDFEHHPYDTSFRIATGDSGSICGLMWMIVEVAKARVSRLYNVRLLSGTVITKGGRRRELDGLLVGDLSDEAVLAAVLEHKHNYERMARMQLSANAALAAEDLSRPKGPFEGKTILMLAGLVVHGPAADRVPPTVEEILKAMGFEGGFFSMGPTHLLLLGEIPLERLYANPDFWALLVAIGLENRKDVTDGLIRDLYGFAYRYIMEELQLKGTAIAVNIVNGLKDNARCRRLALEALGNKRGKEMMDIAIEQLSPGRLAEVRAEGRAEVKVESILRVVRKRFGVEPSDLEAQLLAASEEKLDDWLDRVLDAPNIDEAMKGNGSWGNGTPV